MNEERKGKNISLIVTESCNLSCVYCYEHDKSARVMSFETAKKIIDDAMIDRDKVVLTIDFFGGEPMLNFELIRQVVEYAAQTYKGDYHFFATTNGTLVHGKIKEWLREWRDYITLGLSLDGNKVAHDINRSNSFDAIDLDFFLEMYPSQDVKMTISEQSLPYLAESIEFLHKKGFKVSCNLAYMIDWFAPKNLFTLQEQLEKVVAFYLAHPEYERCNMLDFNISVLSHPRKDEETINAFCGCGRTMVCYDTDGVGYPCQLFAPISAGGKAIKSCDIHINDTAPKSLLPKRCIDCYYQRICPTCLGSNYLSTGDLFDNDEARCKLYKLIFKANAYLKAKEWELGIAKTDDEQGLLRSILEIQSLAI